MANFDRWDPPIEGGSSKGPSYRRPLNYGLMEDLKVFVGLLGDGVLFLAYWVVITAGLVLLFIALDWIRHWLYEHGPQWTFWEKFCWPWANDGFGSSGFGSSGFGSSGFGSSGFGSSGLGYGNSIYTGGNVEFTPFYKKECGIPPWSTLGVDLPYGTDASFMFRPSDNGIAKFDIIDWKNRRGAYFDCNFQNTEFPFPTVRQNFGVGTEIGFSTAIAKYPDYATPDDEKKPPPPPPGSGQPPPSQDVPYTGTRDNFRRPVSWDRELYYRGQSSAQCSSRFPRRSSYSTDIPRYQYNNERVCPATWIPEPTPVNIWKQRQLEAANRFMENKLFSPPIQIRTNMRRQPMNTIGLYNNQWSR